jgi:hypothetical protein
MNPEAAGERAERLAERLQALYHADLAVLDLVALGPAAIPALRRFVFRREPSGIYQPRCHAVSALAALKAEDALLEFLEAAPDTAISDPVQRTGEDAVINAAARALIDRRDDRVFAALMSIAKCRRLAGVIEALGEMRRAESIPYLVAGLAEDFTRREAEAALRKYGANARLALATVALNPIPSAEFETVSSLRTRRSAVAVLRDIGVTLAEWATLRPLMEARDEWLASLACSLGLSGAQPTPDRIAAVRRLIPLLGSSDWLLVEVIEGWLAADYDVTSRVMAEALHNPGLGIAGDFAEGRVRQSLLRVTADATRARLARTPETENRR